MKESQNQNSDGPIFHGSNLRMGPTNVQYTNEKSDLKNALSRSVGGKTYKSAQEAFTDVTKELEKNL